MKYSVITIVVFILANFLFAQPGPAASPIEIESTYCATGFEFVQIRALQPIAFRDTAEVQFYMLYRTQWAPFTWGDLNILTSYNDSMWIIDPIENWYTHVDYDPAYRWYTYASTRDEFGDTVWNREDIWGTGHGTKGVCDPNVNWYYVSVAADSMPMPFKFSPEPSRPVGEFDQWVVNSALGNMNIISYAVQTVGETCGADTFAQTIPNCVCLAAWDAVSQDTITLAKKDVYGNWESYGSVQVGKSYIVYVDSTAPDSVLFSLYKPGYVPYDTDICDDEPWCFLEEPLSGTGFDIFAVPYQEYNMLLSLYGSFPIPAGFLGADISVSGLNICEIRRWNPELQSGDLIAFNSGGTWIGEDPVYPGEPLMVYVARDSCPPPPEHDYIAILVNTSYQNRYTRTLKKAYNACKYRGFSEDRIFVLNFFDSLDCDADGDNDVYGLANETNIRYAFDTWAPAFSDSSTKLFVVFTGIGGEDIFSLCHPSYNLSSILLDSLFDASGSDSIVFIYNASKSGTFVDELSLPGRIILTATNSTLFAWYGSGGIYFPYYVFNKLSLGYSFEDAFNFACSVIDLFIGDAYQIPLLDDNGDDAGHTDPLPNGGDGFLAANTVWGISGSKASLVAPEITLFTVDTTSSPDSIFFHVETSEAVESCWVYAVREDTTYEVPDTCGSGLSCEGVMEIPVSILSNTIGTEYDGGMEKAGLSGSYRFIAIVQGLPESGESIGDLSPAEDAGYVYELGLLDKLLPIEFDMFIEPNPFNTSISVNYNIANASNVSLEIYDVSGQKVVTLINKRKSAGKYTTTWTAPNDIPSGIYFVRLKAGNQTIIKRAILIR